MAGITIKNNEVLRGLMERNFKPLLIRIALEISERYGIIITESYREKRHRNDLHGTNPVRAIDLRSWCYPDAELKELVRWVNNRWEYDFKRKDKEVLYVHDSGQGIHCHLQVHPLTQLRRHNGIT